MADMGPFSHFEGGMCLCSMLMYGGAYMYFEPLDIIQMHLEADKVFIKMKPRCSLDFE